MEDTRVLELILEGKENPTNLSLALLHKITNGFSEERKIGQGGFGEVYKGVLPNGIFVAVKRIVNPIDDQPFRREFNILTKIDHQNVVRFLGFCSNSYQIPTKEAQSEEINLASVKAKLFCFEYISKGSLDQHISDELRGLDWETRYEIIMGICQGLCYLHNEKNIIHMDLKPANILLGDKMVPKLTDFGLSRPNKNSRTMAQPIGTRGYIAPEYEKDGEISFKADIYSLGAIIIELVKGCKGVPHKNNVLRRWRHRWNKPPTSVQYHQVTRCIDMAVQCMQEKPGHRPSISEIIHILSEPGRMNGNPDEESTYLEDDMLGIEPLELPFSFKNNKEMSWSVRLTNKTKAFFAFNIEKPSKHYTIQPDKGIVKPGYNDCLVKITSQPQECAPQVIENADKFIVRSTKVTGDLRDEDITRYIFHEEVPGKVVDEVDILVVYEKGSRKRGQDPDMTVEAVPPPRKRKAIKSSIYEDGKRGQLDRRNFHPPENFSHRQPTNKTYLQRVSDRAMDVTRGAMGSLLHKLGELLKDEFNLDTNVKEDIKSLSRELMKMHVVLHKISAVQQDNLDDMVKRWAGNVREMSYNLEDFVDGFLVHSEPDSSRSSFNELTHDLCLLLEKGQSHHEIGNL
ncbi:serine/threonine-protein kinase ATG1-like [Triticum aestivum]|uniref:serine/threonine-protein kinase ATG1-like n=1 Tax=Triticum aestivum TaxID=4565 RepID=UPI001D003E66|nr:serine/threonine-protein kinase ATG1-like [Triticum aestivum]